MKNLEQIRAAAAIGPSKELDKSSVNKLPAMIINNGLLATIAFVNSESSGSTRSDMAKAMLETAKYLAGRNLIYPEASGSLEGFIEDLSDRNSNQLQRATSEALAFIGYLRRFAAKK